MASQTTRRPRASVAGTAAGGATSPAAAGGPVSFAQAIADNLRSVFHLNFAGVSAFLGGFMVESNLNTHAYNPNENAHSIAQWEKGRWSGPHGLQAYAAAHHLDPLSQPAAIGYLDYELSHGYSSVIHNLGGVTDVNQAAQIVQSQYEGSTPDSLGARQFNARVFYSQLAAGHQLTGGGAADSSGATFGAGTPAATATGGGTDPGATLPDPATLHPPFTAAQRLQIRTILIAAAIREGGTLGGLGSNVDVRTISKMTDAELYANYASRYAILKLNKSSFFGFEKWVQDFKDLIVTPAGHAILNGLLILGGLVALLVAVMLISKSGGRDSSAPAPTNTGTPPAGEHGEHQAHEHHPAPS